ncbi:hypothetical protein B0H34DRAFT_82975 [Crassisporium funariophilum]|nr:hypothetical protein B0H34DRAFT_82975 [Crassisporium funariophilum]
MTVYLHLSMYVHPQPSFISIQGLVYTPDRPVFSCRALSGAVMMSPKPPIHLPPNLLSAFVHMIQIPGGSGTRNAPAGTVSISRSSLYRLCGPSLGSFWRHVHLLGVISVAVWTLHATHTQHLYIPKGQPSRSDQGPGESGRVSQVHEPIRGSLVMGDGGFA